MRRKIGGIAVGLAIAAAAFVAFGGYGKGRLREALERWRPGAADRASNSALAAPTLPAAALEFLGTGFTRGNGPGTSSNTYFAFRDVAADCLPIYPVTVIWRAKPEQKTGYYTTFFWANDGSFVWKNGKPDSYWGAHPYPDTAAGDFTVHHWEIATDFGGDILETISGDPMTVANGRWYLQGFRAWRDPSGQKVHRFYVDLPSLDPDTVIEARVDASFGNATPPNSAFVLGGAPWGSNFGNDETYRGLIRGLQIYNTVLTEAEMLQEARTPLSSSAGRDSIWYLKLDPTVEDMTSDVESGPRGNCGQRRRAPVLRVNQSDIERQGSSGRETVKVRSWRSP